MKKTKKAFTLIEVIVSILIVSIVIIAWFQLYLQASSSKIKIVEQTNLEKNVFYFSEKLFSLINSIKAKKSLKIKEKTDLIFLSSFH